MQLVICHTQIYFHPQTPICTSPFCLHCYKLFPIAFNCLCFEITVIQSSHVASYLRMNLLWLDNVCIMEFPERSVTKLSDRQNLKFEFKFPKFQVNFSKFQISP